MDLGIAGRTALVTGSSRGLGRAAAMALVSEGVNVTVCGRDGGRLAAAVESLTAAGRHAGAGVHALTIDVTEHDAPERLVAETVERFGGLDIVVANTGGPPLGRALEVSDEAILAAINANLLTSVRLVRAAVAHLRARRWGRIVAITSSTVKQPSPTLALSNTARSGLWAWAKTAAADLVADGITLNLICPGTHATERMRELHYPEGTRAGDPEDFGKVVAFLCSAPAAYITGAAIGVDGGSVLGLL